MVRSLWKSSILILSLKMTRQIPKIVNPSFPGSLTRAYIAIVFVHVCAFAHCNAWWPGGGLLQPGMSQEGGSTIYSSTPHRKTYLCNAILIMCMNFPALDFRTNCAPSSHTILEDALEHLARLGPKIRPLTIFLESLIDI